MSADQACSAQPAASLEILVFSVNGVHCGIDSELIGRMMMVEEAGQKALNILWFHNALYFGNKEVVYQNPRIVTLKGTGNALGLAIDQPRDFVKVPVKAICPPPSLFGMTKRLQAFWGAFLLEDKIVLLIDPHKLTGGGFMTSTNPDLAGCTT